MASRADLAEACKLGYTGRSQVLRKVFCRVGEAETRLSATHRAHEPCVGGLHPPHRRETGFLDRLSVW